MNPLPFQPHQHTRADAGRAVLDRRDPRWLLAARAVLAATPSGVVSAESADRLVAWAAGFGMAPVHARGVIATAERAVRRGGLDMRAAEELAHIPEPIAAGSKRPAMVCWAVIPVLVVVAAAMAWWRFGG